MPLSSSSSSPESLRFHHCSSHSTSNGLVSLSSTTYCTNPRLVSASSPSSPSASWHPSLLLLPLLIMWLPCSIVKVLACLQSHSRDVSCSPLSCLVVPGCWRLSPGIVNIMSRLSSLVVSSSCSRFRERPDAGRRPERPAPPTRSGESEQTVTVLARLLY